MTTASLPPKSNETFPREPLSRQPPQQRVGWLEERLDLHAFYVKYGRMVFPVRHTFLLGEMAAFSFIILVITGVYLGLIYTPSNAEIDVAGQRLPQAYASVLLIDSIPVASLFRTVHHWAAHVMVASVIVHALRIFLTGSSRKPREVNWVVGVVLLVLTLMGGFVGDALPYDAFAVTATGIGYSLARSIPLVGNVAADLFFGGTFPTLGSLPRLYTIHVVIVPALIALLLGGPLVIVLKQKHTQPGYARRLAEPGACSGCRCGPIKPSWLASCCCTRGRGAVWRRGRGAGDIHHRSAAARGTQGMAAHGLVRRPGSCKGYQLKVYLSREHFANGRRVYGIE